MNGSLQGVRACVRLRSGSTRQRAQLALLVALAPAWLAAQPALAAVRAFVLPSAIRGDVRPLHQKRVDKGLVDTLGFTGKVTAVADATPVDPPEKGKKVRPPPKTDARLERADTLRQQGTDLQQEGKPGPALARFQAAIAGYRGAFAVLVDYTKLADAYARAGVCAFGGKGGAAEAASYFDAGFRLQPTLAIDRRKADKALLELFDARRAALEAGPRGSIRVEGVAEGAEVFIDGVRVGALPATAPGLSLGEHVVQVRGEGWQPFAKAVTVGRSEAVVKVKLKPVPQEAEVGAGKIIAISDLAACTQNGDMAARGCVKLAAALAKQTACEMVVHPLVVSDRYGRLTLHLFVQRADGKTVAIAPRELDKALSDLNAKLTEIAEEVGTVAGDFPVSRALEGKPKAYR